MVGYPRTWRRGFYRPRASLPTPNPARWPSTHHLLLPALAQRLHALGERGIRVLDARSRGRTAAPTPPSPGIMVGSGETDFRRLPLLRLHGQASTLRRAPPWTSTTKAVNQIAPWRGTAAYTEGLVYAYRWGWILGSQCSRPSRRSGGLLVDRLNMAPQVAQRGDLPRLSPALHQG